MLRSKGLSDKVLLLGIDGMDPRFSRVMVDEGHMPNLKKLIERGSARHDLRLLGGVPTITPPMWTTLATGAYPMTHGVEDFNITKKGELDCNFGGIYSPFVHAEQLWNITAEAGKKTLVWHWPGGSWPPSSDSENLMVVDGTSPGALGCVYARRDSEGVLFASDKATKTKFYYGVANNTDELTGDDKEIKRFDRSFKMPPTHQDYWDELWEEYQNIVGDYQGYTCDKFMDMRTAVLLGSRSQMDDLHKYPGNLSLSQITEPEGWAIDVPEGAREVTWIVMMGHVSRPCLILKNEQGVYDRLAVYESKEATEPLGIIAKDVYTENFPDNLAKPDGTVEPLIRNVRILDLAEDGSMLRMWYSNAFSVTDDRVWSPTWMQHECVKRFGPPTPTGMISNDLRIMRDCNLEQWKQAAKWQADCMNYMIAEHGVEVIFSHFHGPDMSGHMYMNVLKDRYDSRYTEEEIYQLAVGTYEMTDAYIGEFLHLLDEGWSVLVFSDHGLLSRKGDFDPLIGDNFNVNAGVMCELGYTVMKKDHYGNDTADIDWEKTRAVQIGSNSIFINLKGRDRHGIVDPADKWELEEQIITDLYGYRDPLTNHRVIALALHQKDAVLLGCGGDYTAGDIFFCVDEAYVYDHGESLSTAEGYANTSTSPIFVAAGEGIKEGFEMKLFPREVDVAPTAAALLGVRMPAQCEGAPAYSILTEDL